jgi:DNA-binding transcriptional regulator GbsR (MarR family)
MGQRWGINRTVAQIHALLYISERPLHAEEIAETLTVARSNVSNSLKELQGWGIVKISHVMGDRRDHFQPMQDVWELFRTILEERKKREIDPTVALLAECLAEAQIAVSANKQDKAAAALKTKLQELQNFFSACTAFYDQFRGLPTSALIKFLAMGSRLKKFLNL